MTIDLGALRAEFPLTDEWAYLNHAAYGPSSRRTVWTAPSRSARCRST
ncbi:MAG: hypothetical protein QJR03_11855 [Sphaerobacter sp.]|nr:hypothetical protein [Sphaerobacter sp.]